MKIKKALILFSAVAAVTQLSASISVTFNIAGFEDETGVAKNGMNFAIVVDTDHDGFDVGSYSAFDVATNHQYLPFVDGSMISVSDDYYTFGTAGITSTVFAPPLGGNGAIGSIAGIEYNGMDFLSGDPFCILWFASNAASTDSLYGAVTAPSWVVPSNGGAFSNAETVIPGSAIYEIAAMPVPEPAELSAVMGLLILGLGLGKKTIFKKS
jgi:hypothetical protein